MTWSATARRSGVHTRLGFLPPGFRARVEQPKYRMLANEQEFKKGTSTTQNDFGSKRRDEK
jgi:hypothetical protein